jgi:transposase
VKALLQIEHLVVTGVWFEWPAPDRQVLVVRVAPTKRQSGRCPECGRRCRIRDQGDGDRRWRSLDLGSTMVFLEGPAPRVDCPAHGVLVAAVPWARHKARATAPFEDQATWLAAHTAKSTVAALLRTSWRAVTTMVTRVVAEARDGVDRLEGLRRIGIDDKSYKKGHKYLMVVVDHGTGRVVWAKEGRDQATVRAFFDALGPVRAALLTHVSCDGAQWIHDVITERAPQALICMDPFHVQQWAGEAVDEVRRRITRQAKAEGRPVTIGPSRWALLKSPELLTGTPQVTLAQIKKTNGPLYRAYLIKEQLRQAFAVRGEHGRALLAGVISWAARSRIPEMVKLASTLKTQGREVRA